MENRQKQVSRPREKSKAAIPIDLLIEILSRLPSEDVARCRCVSKLWSCMLRRQDFTELFLKMSLTRPRLLFTFIHNGKRIFYSAPQPQQLDPDLNDSLSLSAYYHMDFPKGLGSSEEMCAPVLGFICNKSKKPLICNPSTGAYITLPSAATAKNRDEIRAHFVYDAINKQFKVLCVSQGYDYACLVSSLGTGTMITWRKIECSIPHKSLHTEICIGGMLYYIAKRVVDGASNNPYMVVSFDIRSEKFNFLAVEFRNLWSALINFKGKLGVLLPDTLGVHEHTRSIELLVLEDAEELKWSKTVYILPSYWKDLAADTLLYIVGMTSACEIVFSTFCLRDPFYTFYYNIVKNTVVRIEIQFGIVALKASYSRILTFIDHVENVELMD